MSVEINPFIRYLNIFPLLTTFAQGSIGYDCRIFFVLDGSIFVHVENKDYVVKKNNLIYIPAGVKYSINYPDNKFHDVMTINFDFSKKYAISIPLSSGATLVVIMLAIAPQPIIPTFIVKSSYTQVFLFTPIV